MKGPETDMAKKNEKQEQAGKPVVVTTEHRGGFFGYLTDDDITKSDDGKIIAVRLVRARNCVHWPRENKGFMGLAAMGPLSGARIGPPVNCTLQSITAILEIENPEAVDRWEKQPWD